MTTIDFKGVGNVARFLAALHTFLDMYRYGFHFSEEAYVDDKGTHWGFYRFNQDDNESLFDVDFSIDKEGNGHFHVHGDEVHVDSKSGKRTLSARLRTTIDSYYHSLFDT